MTAIFSLKCTVCGKIHRMRGDKQPETPDQLALEAIRADWGFRMDDDQLVLICSFNCGQDLMPPNGGPRKRAQRPGSPTAALR